jgi:hypothetical protein
MVLRWFKDDTDVVILARDAGVSTAKVADGRGHRPIAVLLGRPASTVRGWLRSFAASAVPVAEAIAGRWRESVPVTRPCVVSAVTPCGVHGAGVHELG